MKKHHWQQPLVMGSQNKEVLKCEANYSYTVRTNSVSVLCESQLPRFRNLPVNEPSKNHLAGWFFRLQSRRLRLIAKDLKKILYGLLFDPLSYVTLGAMKGVML